MFLNLIKSFSHGGQIPLFIQNSQNFASLRTPQFLQESTEFIQNPWDNSCILSLKMFHNGQWSFQDLKFPSMHGKDFGYLSVVFRFDFNLPIEQAIRKAASLVFPPPFVTVYDQGDFKYLGYFAFDESVPGKTTLIIEDFNGRHCYYSPRAVKQSTYFLEDGQCWLNALACCNFVNQTQLEILYNKYRAALFVPLPIVPKILNYGDLYHFEPQLSKIDGYIRNMSYSWFGMKKKLRYDLNEGQVFDITTSQILNNTSKINPFTEKPPGFDQTGYQYYQQGDKDLPSSVDRVDLYLNLIDSQKIKINKDEKDYIQQYTIKPPSYQISVAEEIGIPVDIIKSNVLLKNYYYNPDHNSELCLEKCIALDAFIRFVDPIKDTILPWRDLGAAVYQSILTGKQITDEAFKTTAKKLNIELKGNLTPEKLKGSYQNVQIQSKTSGNSGIYVAQVDLGGKKYLHAFYKLPQNFIQIFDRCQPIDVTDKITLQNLAKFYRFEGAFIGFKDQNQFYNYNNQTRIYIHFWGDFLMFTRIADPVVALSQQIKALIPPKQPDPNVIAKEQKKEENKQKYENSLINFHIKQNIIYPPSQTMNLGSYGKQWLQDTFGIESSVNQSLPNKGQYCHPFLRLVTDYLTCQALKYASELGQPVVEIAAKYNKSLALIKCLGLQIDYDATRPNLYHFDTVYNRRNQESYESVTGKKIDTNATYMASDYGNKTIIAIDSIYYQGVKDFAQYTDNDVLVVCQIVPKVPGHYYNYDDEGQIHVYQKEGQLYVDNRPRNNDKSYNHPLLDISIEGQQVRGRRWNLIDRVQTGTNLFQCLFHITGKGDDDPNLPCKLDFDFNKINDCKLTAPMIMPSKVDDMLNQYLLTKTKDVPRFAQLLNPLTMQSALAPALQNIQIVLQDCGLPQNVVLEPTTINYVMNKAKQFEQAFNQTYRSYQSWLMALINYLIRFIQVKLNQKNLNLEQLFVERMQGLQVNGHLADSFSQLFDTWNTIFLIPFTIYLVIHLSNPLNFLMATSVVSIISVISIFIPLYILSIFANVFRMLFGTKQIVLDKKFFVVQMTSLLLTLFGVSFPITFAIISTIYVMIKCGLQIRLSVNGIKDDLKYRSAMFLILFIVCILIPTAFVAAYVSALEEICSWTIDGFHYISPFTDSIELDFAQVPECDKADLKNVIETYDNPEAHVFTKVDLGFMLIFQILAFIISLILFTIFAFPLFMTLLGLIAVGGICLPQKFVGRVFRSLLLRVSSFYLQKELQMFVNMKLQNTSYKHLIRQFGSPYTMDQFAQLKALFPYQPQFKEFQKFDKLKVNGYYETEAPSLPASTKLYNQMLAVPDNLEELRNLVQEPNLKNKVKDILREAKYPVQQGISKPTVLLNEKIQENNHNQYVSQVNPMNTAIAFFVRQCNPKTKPFPKDHPRHRDSVNFFNDVRKMIKEEMGLKQIFQNFEPIQFEDYIKEVEPHKRDLYMLGWLTFNETAKIPSVYSNFQKWMEKTVKPDTLPISTAFIQYCNGQKNHPFKSRNIFNPSDAAKAVLGLVSKNILTALKQSSYGRFMLPGKSPKQIEEIAQEFVTGSEKIYTFMADGAQFDSHQSELAFTIDDALMDIALPIILDKLDIHGSHRKIITKLAYMKYSRVNYGGNKKRTFVLKGSVFSGQPFRTTLGNTFRIFSITLMIMRKQGIDITPFFKNLPLHLMEVYLMHVGDDQAILSKKKSHILKYAQGVNLYHSENDKEFNYSVTGMIFKDIEINENYFNFISRDFYLKGQVKSFKTADKLHHLGLFLADPLNPLQDTIQSLKGEFQTYKDTIGLQEFAEIRMDQLGEQQQRVIRARSEWKTTSSATPYEYVNPYVSRVSAASGNYYLMQSLSKAKAHEIRATGGSPGLNDPSLL